MPRQQQQKSKSPQTFAPPPKIWHATPPVSASTSIFQSMKDGIGLGMGSAIGHRIIGGFFGPSTSSPPSTPSTSSNSLPIEKPFYASQSYTQCVEYNKENPEICRPFLSKDKSPWTLCMEQNFFKADYCSTETSTSR